jgi:transcriptional regulator GlxA family with amidase domain
MSGDTPSSSGATLTSVSFGDAKAVDTLIVVGGEGTREAMQCPLTYMFVRDCAEQSRRVASVCSGSYVLAAAGLLNGRVATTHWSRSADFARRYPQVRLDADRIFTRDGKFWTSGGVTAGIDLALALIEEDLGEPTAKRIAQQLVVYQPWSGCAPMRPCRAGEWPAFRAGSRPPCRGRILRPCCAPCARSAWLPSSAGCAPHRPCACSVHTSSAAP